MIFLTASLKSLFRSETALCPAAKWEQTKQRDVACLKQNYFRIIASWLLSWLNDFLLKDFCLYFTFHFWVFDTFYFYLYLRNIFTMYRKRMATVPLFPVAPPKPVLTSSMATSVIWGEKKMYGTTILKKRWAKCQCVNAIRILILTWFE